VVALAAEHAVGGDPDRDEEVAGRSTALPRSALAAEPDPLAVLDPGRHLRLDGAHRPPLPAAVAGRAGLVVDQLPTAARRAGLVHRERTADRRHHEAVAVAGRAPVRAGARLAPGARAGRAGRVGRDPQRHGDAVERLGEPDGRRGLEVGTAGRPGLRAPGTCSEAEEVAEQVAEAAPAAGPVAEQVLQVDGAGVAAAAGGEPARREELARLVVLLALVRVADDVVGLGDLLELLVLGAVVGVRVRVVGARELAVGLLDLVGRRGLADAEHGVEVLGRPVRADAVRVTHRAPPFSRA
jgi:hypothetical protein